MTDKKKAVVIGAGHNGLVCATYLAKAGFRVTVFEARDSVGGAAATASLAGGYKVSALAHITHGLHPDICRELGLGEPVSGKRLDTVALNRKGAHLTLTADKAEGGDLSTADIAAYAAFKKEFSSYARALTPLYMNRPPRLKDMDFKDKTTLVRIGWQLRFGLGVDSMREFLRVGGINIYDVLNETFESELLKAAIAADAVIGHHMGPRTPTTVLTYLQKLFGETVGAAHAPAGGMGEITGRLEKAAVAAGVEIRLNAAVTGVAIEDGRAVGLVLESGERVDANLVVSNADAKSSFLKLVGSRDLDAMFVNRISKTRTDGTVAKLNLALNGLPAFKGLDAEKMAQRLLIAPDLRYIEHAFNHAKYGEFSERPVLETVIPSLGDPSMAPSGHHVMSVNASFAPYNLRAGWADNRGKFFDRIVETLEVYAPGIRSLIVEHDLLTPADIENRFHVTGGHWHHGEMTIDQSFMMRPVHGSAQYDTPIDGLFLCGAAAHPGGGVTGIPGHNAAKRIIAMTGGK